MSTSRQFTRALRLRKRARYALLDDVFVRIERIKINRKFYLFPNGIFCIERMKNISSNGRVYRKLPVGIISRRQAWHQLAICASVPFTEASPIHAVVRCWIYFIKSLIFRLVLFQTRHHFLQVLLENLDLCDYRLLLFCQIVCQFLCQLRNNLILSSPSIHYRQDMGEGM